MLTSFYNEHHVRHFISQSSDMLHQLTIIDVKYSGYQCGLTKRFRRINYNYVVMQAPTIKNYGTQLLLLVNCCVPQCMLHSAVVSCSACKRPMQGLASISKGGASNARSSSNLPPRVAVRRHLAPRPPARHTGDRH